VAYEVSQEWLCCSRKLIGRPLSAGGRACYLIISLRAVLTCGSSNRPTRNSSTRNAKGRVTEEPN
jgi:hypothetical protein